MGLPNLSGSNIQDTYQRVLHTDGLTLFNGTGSSVSSLNLDVNQFVANGDAQFYNPTVFSDNVDMQGNINLIGNVTASGIIKASAFINTGNTNLGLNLRGAGTEITGSLDVTQNITATNITASGNISSSGTIVGSNLNGTNTGDQDLGAYMLSANTASFAITSSNVLFGDITSSNNISSSGTITANSFIGNGLSIDGPSNSHIEVGEYPVGYDFLNLPGSGLVITGSGLIISGAMADANHHNMLKIGNVELIDLNTSVSPNEFLIHNVASFKMTSGSDGGDVANETNNIFVHNGHEFFLLKGGESPANATIKSEGTATTISDTDIVINAVNGPIFRALNSTTSTYLAGFDGNPHSSATQNMRSIAMSNIYSLLGGAVTASAVSSSGTITATSFVGTVDGGSF